MVDVGPAHVVLGQQGSEETFKKTVRKQLQASRAMVDVGPADVVLGQPV